MIENFAPNLIRLRKEKKLSQKELAQELGISAQTISNIENQTAYPTFANFDKMAKF
ncbi:helix-turn-helix domain-containing protein, partial [Streptococcus pluranimalium]